MTRSRDAQRSAIHPHPAALGLAAPRGPIETSADGLLPALEIDDLRLDNPLRLLAAPLVLPAALGRALHRAAITLAEQAMASTSTPGDGPPPLITVDFALCGDDERGPHLELIELQAFPSVFATLWLLARWQAPRYRLDDAQPTPAGTTLVDALALLRRSVLADHAPTEVALVDVAPAQQRNLADLRAHHHLLGVPIEDLADLEPARTDGARSRRTGRTYRRIYNRVIAEEAIQHGLGAALDALTGTGLTWANHPRWFHRISKATLPRLRHPCAPPALACDDPAVADLDLRDWILKPAFDRGGHGVDLHPDAAALARIPPPSRGDWLVQRRVNYAPLVLTPAGPRLTELRALLLWPPGRPRPEATLTFFRMNTEPAHAIARMSEPYAGSGVVWWRS